VRLPEQRLWDRFRRNSAAAGLLLNRVENLVGVGDPDVETIAVGGVVTKLELKAIEEPPKRATTPLLGEKRGLSIEQRNFMLNWIGLGGRGYVLIGVGVGHEAEQHLMHGSYAEIINRWTLAEVRAHAVASDWRAINLTIRGKT
jgi:hypothetical protein